MIASSGKESALSSHDKATCLCNELYKLRKLWIVRFELNIFQGFEDIYQNQFIRQVVKFKSGDPRDSSENCESQCHLARQFWIKINRLNFSNIAAVFCACNFNLFISARSFFFRSQFCSSICPALSLSFHLIVLFLNNEACRLLLNVVPDIPIINQLRCSLKS